MKIIIEAGSSKTECRIIDNNCVVQKQIITSGINPVTDPRYENSIKELTNQLQDLSTPVDIHYYGSGCIHASINQKVEKSFCKYLDNIHLIEISDDLLGSAKAACQYNEGLVCIIGTGSIIGYYDGNNVIHKLPSAGYLIGDEGSGFHIGQLLMRKYLRGLLPVPDMQIISDVLKISNEDFINQLYTISNPRKYLASLAPLVNKIDCTERDAILNEVFEEMAKNMIVPMTQKYGYPPNFIGSIAFYFQDIIVENLQKFNIIAGSFHRSAIEGLIQYHHHEKRN